MVSPVHPAEVHVVTHTVLQALDLPNDPLMVGSSVIPLPNEGYAVTVVSNVESLKVHLLRVDADGNVFPLFEGGQV